MATSTPSTPPSTADSNFQFLVHAEDGSFPFLTEYLLRKYFNPKDEIVKNHLVVGIAVKDTCVVPVYKEKQNKKLKRKRSNGNQEGSGNEENPQGKELPNTLKPSGYTFDTQPIEQQTRLLPGYHTMSLPTFDLLDDAQAALEKDKAARTKNAQKKSKKSGNSSNEESTAMVPSVTSTRDKLSLNSPNGMQQITPKMYTDVALKLQCTSMLALYDQVHKGDGKNRKSAAAERTKLWLENCLSALGSSSQEKIPMWASLSCYDTQWSYANSSKYLMEKRDLLAGISIAGWHRIQARDERNELLGRIAKEFYPGTKFSVLAVSNMEQILDAIKHGVSIIGSDLPAIWARSNKALALNIDSPASSSIRTLDDNGCIDLGSEKYCRDTSPILPGCSCLSCQDGRYTASYLHHLIKAKELLSQILLFGHNLHQMLLLFEKLSTGAKGNEVGDLLTHIEDQLHPKH